MKISPLIHPVCFNTIIRSQIPTALCATDSILDYKVMEYGLCSYWVEIDFLHLVISELMNIMKVTKRQVHYHFDADFGKTQSCKYIHSPIDVSMNQ